jgi:pyruvate formate lyase activating enzyme
MVSPFYRQEKAPKCGVAIKMLKVGGFVPFTTIDFPGVNAACVVFCQGCPWRCPYCQNKNLQTGSAEENFAWDEGDEGETGSARDTGAAWDAWDLVLAKITARKGFLDGVVFSGGEPLAQDALADAAYTVKQLGMKVGLHTGGAYPERLRELLNGAVDWVGLDIKTCFDEYDSLTGVPGSGLAVQHSLNILIDSSIDFECRTTVDPAFVSPQHIEKISKYLSLRGVKIYKLQRCYDENRKPVHSPCFTNDIEMTKCYGGTDAQTP